MNINIIKKLLNNKVNLTIFEIGAEGKIFNGGKNILKNTKYIYTEYSNLEWYEGQNNLYELLNILGQNWKLKKMFQDNVLLENKNFQEQ